MLVAALPLAAACFVPIFPASATPQSLGITTPCQSALAKVQNEMGQPMIEAAARAMIEAGAPPSRGNMPSREAVGAGWAVRQLDTITSAQSACGLERDALDRFSETDVRDTLKLAASADRATCRALLKLIHDGAENSYMRRNMGLAASPRSAAQLRRTLFEDIWPACPDIADEELVQDTRTSTSKDLSTALEAGQ